MRARTIFFRNLSSFLVKVVELIGGLSVVGIETNRTVLESDGEDILTSEGLSLSSRGLSLSNNQCKDGSFMVKSLKLVVVSKV